VDIPLFCLVTASQVHVNMWQRNGQCMKDQVLNYAEYPFCRIYKELDVALVQFLLTVQPSAQFLSQLFFRFGVAEYLALRRGEALSETGANDVSYLPALLDEALKCIINLVTELPTRSAVTVPAAESVPSTSDDKREEGSKQGGGALNETESAALDNDFLRASSNKAKYLHSPLQHRLLPLLRREMLHKLICGPALYSELQECFQVYPEASKLDSASIDAIVSEIATKNDTSLTGPPNYHIKKELWVEYDPCFPRIQGRHNRLRFWLLYVFLSNLCSVLNGCACRYVANCYRLLLITYCLLLITCCL
jgi:hypothetical protein